MDKRLLDLADKARLARLEQISTPLPPRPPPEYAMPDGRVLRYVGPWNPNEADEARQREVEELSTLPLVHLIHSNAHVHAWYTAYLWELEQESPAD